MIGIWPGGGPVECCQAARPALRCVISGAGFYRTCALDGILEHAPTEHVRHPTVPAACRTLTCALPGVLVAQGDLVGLGDVVGLDGPESCAQALAGLP